MAYYRNGSRRGGGASLKPPAELVNEQVEWTPKDAVGRRGSRQIGRVISFDVQGRTLDIEVSQAVSMWQPNPTRSVTIALSSGPFTVMG